METVVQETPTSEATEKTTDNLPEVRDEAPAAPAAPMDFEKGLMSAKNSNDEWRIASLMLKSNALPQQFKNVPQVVMALQFLKAHGLPPMVAIRQTTIINGTLSIWGELPLALGRRSGKIKEWKEILFDKAYKEINFENKNLNEPIFGALCRMVDDKGQVTERSFTVADAITAGLWSKDIWKKYPKRMIQMRTRGWTLKDALPEVLSAVSIAEYDHDMVIEENADGSESRRLGGSVADEMNAVLVDEKEANQESSSAQSN